MKNKFFQITLVALATMLFASCNKDEYGVPSYALDKNSFESIIEIAEPASSYNVVSGDYELVVTGVTVAHSHEDALPFTAVLNKYDKGVLVSSTNITAKCVWGCEPWGYASVSNATYTSVYKGALKSRNTSVPVGLIPEAKLNAICQYSVDDNTLKLSVPITFRETVHVGFKVETRRTVVPDNNGKWEFQAKASYALPFTANVYAKCGNTAFISWQIGKGKTFVEYLTDPNNPINDENEALNSEVNYVVFNDADKSTRCYVSEEKRCYFIHAQVIE